MARPVDEWLLSFGFTLRPPFLRRMRSQRQTLSERLALVTFFGSSGAPKRHMISKTGGRADRIAHSDTAPFIWFWTPKPSFRKTLKPGGPRHIGGLLRGFGPAIFQLCSLLMTWSFTSGLTRLKRWRRRCLTTDSRRVLPAPAAHRPAVANGGFQRGRSPNTPSMLASTMSGSIMPNGSPGGSTSMATPPASRLAHASPGSTSNTANAS